MEAASSPHGGSLFAVHCRLPSDFQPLHECFQEFQVDDIVFDDEDVDGRNRGVENARRCRYSGGKLTNIVLLSCAAVSINAVCRASSSTISLSRVWLRGGHAGGRCDRRGAGIGVLRRRSGKRWSRGRCCAVKGLFVVCILRKN